MKLFLYRLWQLFVMAPVVVVTTIVTALFTMAVCALGFGRWGGYYPPRFWARVFCLVSLVKVTVKGREHISPNTSYLFVANHQGAYDIFSIYGYLNHNFRWMMKQSLRKIPFVGAACAWSKQIFVDNSSVAGVKRTMEEAEAQLRGGMSLVVFPEGARTWNGRMRPFKKGAYKLAMEFDLPVVPVTIDGAFDVMPRFKKLPLWGHITLTIHKPVMPEADGHDLERLMTLTRRAINSALPAAQRDGAAE